MCRGPHRPKKAVFYVLLIFFGINHGSHDLLFVFLINIWLSVSRLNLIWRYGNLKRPSFLFLNYLLIIDVSRGRSQVIINLIFDNHNVCFHFPRVKDIRLLYFRHFSHKHFIYVRIHLFIITFRMYISKLLHELFLEELGTFGFFWFFVNCLCFAKLLLGNTVF